jgi:outer membrane lipoprotein LolB
VIPARAVRARSLPCAAVALFLAGCAEIAFVHPPQAAGFELTGRFAAAFRGEGASGTVAWRHAAATDELLVSSPLGQAVARIVREHGEVVLSTPEPREYRAADAEELTEKVLGFRLPLAGLAHWVRGQPAPGPASERRDASGLLQELTQGGWRIRYLGYDEGRPIRLVLAYPGLELRLAISSWK